MRDKFEDVFRFIKGTGKIRQENIEQALKKIKMAFLEADVNYRVVRHFIDEVKKKALGESVLKSVSPSQQFIKIVYDEMVKLLGTQTVSLPETFPVNKQTIIMLVGLNGSGKTTTAIKLARKYNKSNPVVIAADPYRPAAVDQLLIMGKKYSIPVFYDKKETFPLRIIQKGIKDSKEKKYNLIIIDTAGRMEMNKELMNEIKEIAQKIKPDYRIFVADALTGQNLINVAKEFQLSTPLNGAILTKFDSDARGGAALSLKYLTKTDIFYIGTGEKLNDLDKFSPSGIAKRILGMADVISFVEQAQEMAQDKELSKLEEKIKKKNFDFNDFLSQLRMINKTGSFRKMLETLPVKIPAGANIDEKKFKHIEAIILSMTPAERENEDLLDLSRKLRIAKGAGRPVGEVTQLMKQFKNMKKMLKKVLKNDINSITQMGHLSSLFKM